MRKIALGILCVIILSFSWSVNVFASSEEDNPKPEEPTKITYESPDPERDVEPRETTDMETIANEETEADKLRDKYELKIEGLNYDYAEKYESAAGGVTLALIIVAMFLLVFTLELIHTKCEVMRLTEKIEKMEKMNN
ncbi:hypothetical protein IKF25_00925 [Candidatus Saccharibacteria bacterium]|nr:hypothetical protein [Candidatus Saccharibacteria bacterium]